MTNHVGFTGTQVGMSERQKFHFRHFLATLRKADEYNFFHMGDCIGADIEAAVLAKDGWFIISHPPIIRTKRAFCLFATEIRPPKDYLTRNHDIVDECSHLIATPKENIEVLRSGTWATIRYAKKQKKQVTIIQRED